MIALAYNGGDRDEFAAPAAKLQETIRLLNMAERLAQLGHWRLDADGRCIERSPQSGSMLGIAADQPLSARTALRMVDADDRQMVLRCIAAAMGGGTEISCRAQITRADGLSFPVVLQFCADIQDHNGPKRLFGIIRDITEKAEAERKLTAARDDAEAATRAKSEFLATMSHEIRTPMTGVMGMIELLLSDPSAEERDRYLSAMKQSAELLMTVLDGILDFSKVESGKMELHCCDFDFAALARRTIDMFQNAASKKGLLFDLKVGPGQSSVVYGDPVRLQQVLSNLVSNAIKFTDQGRISVLLRAKLRRGGRQCWRAEVRDTGVGIDPAELSRLFEPFVQTGDRRFGGTGLGLTISRRLLEAMNGRTGVKSMPGQGSTFWFEVDLPVGRLSTVPVHPDGPSSAPTRPVHVLIAEDNPINQMLVSALIRQLGHRATCVDNGLQAVEAAKTLSIDCILMDMQMPEMDGSAATRAIRSGGGANAAVPIIALSADAAPERRRFYDNIGLTDFMTKPISIEALRRTLAPMALSAAIAPNSEGEEPVVHPERLTELSVVLGPQKYFMLLRLLAAELLERPGDLTRAIAAADMPALRAQAHNLAGAAANLGAGRVARAARAVELAAPGVEAELAVRRLKVEASTTHRAGRW